jgi:perosamine synthetase
MSVKNTLYIARPSLGKEELEAVAEVFKSCWLGLGPKVYEFENQLKEYLGARNVVAVSTGTNAIHIALAACGVSAGDEVIVPSLTFIGSVQPVILCGATPVFCEVDSETINIDIKDAQKKITSRTKAIIAVHYGGLACDMDALMALCRGRNITLIEDAAHAFGSSYRGRRIGSFGDATCFSFDPIKSVTCGEGGAVATNNDALAEQMRRKRLLGIDKDTVNRYKGQRSWFYEVVTSGYRYHMSDINAAIGLAQLKKMPAFLERKKQIVRRYDEALRGVGSVRLLRRNYEETANFNYVIRVDEGQRDSLLEFLNKNGVQAGVQYIPCHIQPLFQQHKQELPVTEKLWKQVIALPLYYDLSEDDVSRVIETVREFFK